MLGYVQELDGKHLLGGNEMTEKQAQSSGESSNNSEAMDIFGFPQYPRPDSTVKLFASSGIRQNEVIVGGNDNDWDLYCMGYWRAADALVDHLTQTRDPSAQRPYAAYWESQAYAALFLYRHYLELRLKELFMAYGGEPAKINNEHVLLNIWREVRQQDDDTRAEEPSPDSLKDVDAAENVIVQFDDIDRKSEVFRYPKDKKGEVTLPSIQIDMIRLKEALGWLSQFLDGWSVGVYEYKHVPRE